MKPYVIVLLFLGCGSSDPCAGNGRQSYLCQREKERHLPCQDEARLLATAVGSPSRFECPNKLHRMRHEVSRAVSGEEIGVIVVCECERASGAAGGAAP